MVTDRSQPETSPVDPCSGQGGFTYLGVLFAIALAGIAFFGAGILWELEGRREKEKELLFSGEQYRRAIDSYYAKSPGEAKQYPEKLEDLLEDKRHPNPIRHLRRLFREPMSPDGQWELIRQQGRVVGVCSRSDGVPIKVAGFTAEQEGFESANTYADWKFSSGGGGMPVAGDPAMNQPSVQQNIER